MKGRSIRRNILDIIIGTILKVEAIWLMTEAKEVSVIVIATIVYLWGELGTWMAVYDLIFRKEEKESDV